ncbi:MAG: transposase [Chloroflexota bacterium]|nr:transposase [Chloroflexota bacterium]
MRYDPRVHHRRSIRLKGYDYSQAGAYFVTICVRWRERLLGEVVDGETCPNAYGAIVARCWDDLPRHYPTVELDAFVVMPNHVHGVILLTNPVAGDVGAGLKPARSQAAALSPASVATERSGAGLKPAPTGDGAIVDEMAGEKRRALSEIVRAFKTFSARRINEARGTAGSPVWQRGYWDHIIRNDRSLRRFQAYIIDNPARWEMDQLHPDNPSKW